MNKFLVLLFSMMFFWGCASTPQYDTQLFFVGSGVQVQQLEANHTIRAKDGDILVNVSGIGETNQVVYYKVEWYNEFGMPIKTILSTWKSASIIKGMPFNWSAVSPSPKAVRFKILIAKNIGNGILN